MLFLLIFLIIKNFSKYKIIRYLKIFLNKSFIYTIIISSVISNTYILYLNSKYNNFYEKAPKEINAEAIIIRRLTRKRIYRYVYNKNKIGRI